MIDWNLRSRSHSCHKCSADFIDGERCNAATVPKWDYQVASIVTAGDAAADMIAGDRAYTANWQATDYEIAYT